MFMGGFYSSSRSGGFTGFNRSSADEPGTVIDGELVDSDRPGNDEKLR
jgi:hypothetical protein